jgi:hypothetical protein
VFESVVNGPLSLSGVMGAGFRLPRCAMFISKAFFTPVPVNLILLSKDIPFFSCDRIPLTFLCLHQDHMFQIRNLFCILSKFHILQILNLLLSKNKLIFAMLISGSKLFLEIFHLLNENLFVFESLLQNLILFFLSLEVKFKQEFVLLRGGVASAGEGLDGGLLCVASAEDHVELTVIMLYGIFVLTVHML